MPPQTKKYKVLLLASLGFVLIAVNLYFFKQMLVPKPAAVDQNLVTNTPKHATVDQSLTTSWKTHRNDEYGFEIKYPSNWALWAEDNFLSLDSPQVHERRLKNPYLEYPGDLTIAIDKNPTRLSAQEFYDGNHGIVLFDNPGQDKVITFAGRTAFYTKPTTGIISYVPVIIVPVEAYFIRIEAGVEIEPIDEILSTFKFTK